VLAVFNQTVDDMFECVYIIIVKNQLVFFKARVTGQNIAFGFLVCFCLMFKNVNHLLCLFRSLALFSLPATKRTMFFWWVSTTIIAAAIPNAIKTGSSFL